MALAIAMILGQRHANAVGMFIGDEVGKSGPVSISKNISVLDATKEYAPKSLFTRFYAHMSIVVQMFRRKDILHVEGWTRPSVSPFFVFFPCQQIAYSNPYRESYYRTESPNYPSRKCGGFSKVVHNHVPGTMEHRFLGSVLHQPPACIGIKQGLIRDAEQRTGNKVSALSAFSVLVGAAHGEPTNRNKAVGEKRDSQIGDFSFTANYFIRTLCLFILGVAITAIGGFFFFDNYLASLFGAVILWVGIFITVSSPFLATRW